MSSLYYTMRDAKVRIAHELMNRGWEVLGYHADESDMMTDYYSPAYWNGIATKNGFVLVIDRSYQSESQPIKKYNYNNCLSHADREKINKLEKMTIENGATQGEEENAQRMIERIKSNTSDLPEEVITGYTVAHLANPKACKWHIEKDGVIYDKGTGISKYSDLPNEWQFDINTMQYEESYKYYSDWEDGEYIRKERKLTEDQTKVVNQFKALILKWERIVNSMNTMGDGTAETEQQAQEQQQNERLEKVIEKVTKKVLKMVEVKRNYFQVGDYITLSHHGHYWKITREYMQKGTWKGVADTKKAFVYEIVGKASRGYKELKNPQGYYNFEFKMLKDLEEGKIKIFELKEVEEVQEVEKWVRVKIETKKSTVTAEPKQSTEKEENQVITINEVSIVEDVDTRDNSQLWVVKLNNKVDKKQFNNIKTYMQSLKGYYSRFKGGFIFKFDPTITLGGQEPEIIEVEEIPQENEKITENILIDKVEEKAENLISESTTIMERLELNHSNYFTNEEYRSQLLNYIRERKFNKETFKSIIDYIVRVYNFEGLIEVLKGFYSLEFQYNSQATEQPEQVEETKNNITEVTEQEKPTTENSNVINFNDYRESNYTNFTITEEQKEIENMNIFDKFENIVIENDNRISHEDKQFCEDLQNQYKKASEIYSTMIDKFCSLTNIPKDTDKYYSIESENKYLNARLLKDLKETLLNIKDNFIHNIVWYFRDKYNVTIDIESIQKKYDIDITYEIVLDEIFLQLDGLTFIEKAVNEVKNNIRKIVNENGWRKAEIKGKKIRIDSFFYIDSFDKKWGHDRVSYNSDSNFQHLLTALSNFEYGVTHNCLDTLYNVITNAEGERVFTTHEFIFDKVDSLKLYKNGKIEITFSNSNNAYEFAKEYLNYKDVA